MNRGTIQLLLALLRSELHGNFLSEEEKALFKPEHLTELYAVSDKHDLAHLVGAALKRNGLLPKGDPVSAKFTKKTMQAVYRYEQINFELGRITALLEKSEIPFIPLKGSVLRDYYREPWMRTSCDIDILVRDSDTEKAALLLKESLGYEEKGRDAHDIGFFSPKGVHIELHFNLVEEGRAQGASAVLASVWEASSPAENCKFKFIMSDPFFYFYHVAHMAKHFETGGCGIRPVLDLWILDNLKDINQTERNELLQKGRLLEFARAMGELSRVWLENAQPSQLTSDSESFILRGGVYGTTENRVLVQQQSSGGKGSYARSRILLPYNSLKLQFPILEKHKWLSPLFQIVRWVKILLGGRRKNAVNELKYSKNISQSQADKTAAFLENLGLKE